MIARYLIIALLLLSSPLTLAGWQSSATGMSGGIIQSSVDPADADHVVAFSTITGAASGVMETRNGGVTWTQNSLPVSSSTAMIDPLTLDVYLLRDANSYRSNDAGRSWVPINIPGTFFVVPGALFASTAPGLTLQRSLDKGATWQAVGTGLPAQASIKSIDASSAAPERLYALIETASASFPFTASYQLFVSQNRGLNWTGTVANGLPMLNYVSPAVFFDGNNAAAAYVNGPHGIFRTLDGGDTWQSSGSLVMEPLSTSVRMINSPLVLSQQAEATYQAGPLGSLVATSGTSLMSVPSGLLRTINGGSTWTSTGTVPLPPLALLAVDAQGAVYAQGALYDQDAPFASGSFRSDDAGLTWKTLSAGQAGLGDVPVITTKAGIRIYAESYQSLHTSIDQGETWSRADWAGAGATASRILVDPIQSQRLFAATAQGVYRSDDSGQTWLQAIQGLPSLYTFDMAIDTAGVLYVTNAGSIYRSTDAAQTWVKLDLAPRIANFAVSPADSRVLVGHNNRGGGDPGVWVSSNSGATWTKSSFAPSIAWNFVGHPTNPDLWLIPGSNDEQDGQCGVWRSTDRGANWTFVTSGFPAPSDVRYCDTTRGIAYDRSNASTVYVTARFFPAEPAIYRSDDAGLNWRPASNGLPNTRFRWIEADVNDLATLYAAGSLGVFVSRNHATSWQAIPSAGLPAGITTDSFNSMTTVPGQPGVILATSFFSGGVVRYTPQPVATALTIHGPSQVQEGNFASFAATLSWSDGTKTEINPQWGTSNQAVASIQPSGSLQAGLVSFNSAVIVNASYGGLSSSYPVTVLDTSGYITSAPGIVAGWNLLGNSVNSPINVVATFGNVLNPIDNLTSRVSTVWKWDSVNSKWLFFSPSLTPSALITYAAANGFGVLNVVYPGEGFWINASAGFSMPPQTGDPVFISRNSLINGWNLLSSGSGKMPSAVNWDFSLSPPSQLVIPNNFVSLWAWDTAAGKWFFYSPSLDALGPTKVKEYADSNGFLDFVTRNRSLHPGSGFWINMTTTNPSSNLTPLNQAKGMFGELRTTINAFANNNKTGFLDQQVTRHHTEMANKVAPDIDRFSDYIKLAGKAADLFDDVNNGATTSYQVGQASDFNVQAITGNGAVAYRFVSINGISYGCFSNAFQTTPAANGLTAAGCGPSGPFPYNSDTTFSPTGYSWTKPIVQVFKTPDSSVLNYSSHLRQYTYTYSTGQIAAAELPNFTGTLTRGFLATTGNPSSIVLAGELPPSASTGALKDTVAISFTRAVQDAANSVYRYNLTGNLTSIAPVSGATMVAISLDPGTHFDEVEDAGGTAAINAARGLNVIGTIQTASSKFTGTLTLGAFALDADEQLWAPTSMLLDGSFTDLSSGGAGTFLTGRLAATVNNWPIVHSAREESALNFVDTTLTFTGTVKATGRPEMRLVVGATTAGYGLNVLNVNYSYGTISVTGSGTLDDFNDANNSLTLTNQDGITVRFVPQQDATIKKSTQTLGVIPYGSSIIYYTDGYFESL